MDLGPLKVPVGDSCGGSMMEALVDPGPTGRPGGWGPCFTGCPEFPYPDISTRWEGLGVRRKFQMGSGGSFDYY